MKHVTTSDTMKEIKKELKPFADICKELKRLNKLANKLEREKKIEETYKKRIEKVKKEYYCDKCGAAVSINDKSCPNCESQFVNEIQNMYYCNNCYNQVDKDVEKCPKCGATFEEAKSKCDDLITTLNKDLRNYNWEKMNREELTAEIKRIIKIIDDNIEQVNKYISNNTIEYDSKKRNAYKNKTEALNKKRKTIEKKVDEGINKAELLVEYNKILTINQMMNKTHIEMIDGKKAKPIATGRIIKSKNASIIENENNHNLSYNDNFTRTNECVDDVQTEEKNDDIVYRNLEDWQQREVDEGNYDSTSFEEEELEDDDYYSEDDQ